MAFGALGALLSGFGGIGQGLVEAQKERQRQQELDQINAYRMAELGIPNKRLEQEAAANKVTLPSGQVVDARLVPYLVAQEKTFADEREKREVQRLRDEAISQVRGLWPSSGQAGLPL